LKFGVVTFFLSVFKDDIFYFLFSRMTFFYFFYFLLFSFQKVTILLSVWLYRILLEDGFLSQQKLVTTFITTGNDTVSYECTFIACIIRLFFISFILGSAKSYLHWNNEIIYLIIRLSSLYCSHIQYLWHCILDFVKK